MDVVIQKRAGARDGGILGEGAVGGGGKARTVDVGVVTHRRLGTSGGRVQAG